MAGTRMAEIEAVVTADTSNFDAGMAKANQSLDTLGTKAQGSSANFGAASATMAAGAVGIGAGLADAIGMAGDFQSSMNGIQAVTGATSDEMTGLSDVALQVGMDTAFSAQEGADAITELGKAGIPISDIMDGAAMSTASLAAAGEVDMARAAEVMSNAMNTFRIDGTESARVADVLAAGANTSASSINDLAFGMAQAGAGAAALGIPLEDTVASLALFADRGMQGSDAGTSMKTMLARLTPATKPAREAFTDLGLGMWELNDAGEAVFKNKFFDDQGNFVGMAQASDILYDSMKDLTDVERQQAIETLFGSDAGRAAELVFQAQKEAAEGTGKGMHEYIDAVQANGQATDVANAKMAGMNGALEALSGSIDTAKIAFGMAFLPAIESVADALSSLVNMFLALPQPVQQVISFVTAGVAAFLAVGSAIGFIVGPLGAFVGALGPVAAGIVAIAAPLALVVAGIAALYVAYQTNFLGFADGVNAAAGAVVAAFTGIVSGIQTAITQFQSLVASGMNPIQAATEALAMAFPSLSGAILAVGGAIQGIVATVQSIVAEFQRLISIGIGPVNAAVIALSEAFPALSGAFSTAGALVQNFIDTLQGIATGFQEVIAGIQAGDLGGVLQGIFDIANAAITGFVSNLRIIGEGIIQAFQAVDWSAVGAAIQTGLQNASTAIETWLQEASDAILAGFQAIDWPAVSAAFQSGIQTAMDAIGPVVQAAMDALGPIVEAAWTGIEGAVSAQLDTIKATVTAAWTAVQETVALAMQTITQIATDTWNGINVVIGGALETIKATVLAAWTSVQETVALTMQTVTQTVSDAWNGINTTIGGILSDISATVSTAWSDIQSVIAAALAAIQSGIAAAWAAMQSGTSAAFAAMGVDIGAQIKAIQTTIVEGIIVAKQAFLDTIASMASEAATAMAGVKDAIVAVFADAGSWLVGAGQQIMAGLASGIQSGIAGVVGQINSAVASIQGALSGLNVSIPVPDVTPITTAFGSIGPGAAQAINAGTPQVETAVQNTAYMAGLAARHELDSASPSMLFYEIFQSVPEGAALAIEDGTPMVADAVVTMVSRALTPLESALMDLAIAAGDGFAENLATTLANGAQLSMNAAGFIVDQFGNVLVEDFTLLNKDITDQTSTFWTDWLSTTKAGTAAIEDAFAAMHANVSAEMGAMASDAAAAAADINKSLSSVGSDSGHTSKSTTIDKSGGTATGKHANASGGSVHRGDVHGNADIHINASGGSATSDQSGGDGSNHRGGSGNIHIQNVNLRDERHLHSWARRHSRSRQLQGSRGRGGL